MKRKHKLSDGKRAENAARQAAYRKRHLRPGAPLADMRARLNMVVQPGIAHALKRLAQHYGVTQVEALARAIQDAESRAIKKLSSTQLREYYGDRV
jgi:hypothetical protein